MGALGAVAAVVGGAIGGVSQVVRGVAAIPASISEPRKGNWWDENEGKWVETDLIKERTNLEGIPEDDKDVRQKSFRCLCFFHLFHTPFSTLLVLPLSS